jgi:two-component system, cell cycle sensor histidine kinase and response regulator CckA
MPGMGAGDTYDQLQAIEPSIKVLLSSGYGVDQQTNEILQRGWKGFIQKPFNMQALSEKIREVLQLS